MDIGVRATGTEGERRAANYIRDQLTGYGYEASLQPFPFTQYVDVLSELEVVAPQARSIEALALVGSISGTAEGRLVSAGSGYPQDFPVGTDGSIVLVQRGEIRFSEKVTNAANAGATAVIVYNNEPGVFPFQLSGESEIPAVAISQEDGQALLDQLASLGPAAVTVRVSVQGETVTQQSQNVVARAPGHLCRVVVGGHYDSVPAGPGANDNASGTATVIEIARVLAADGEFDDVCFALFGAEEIGLVGSAYYVGQLTPGAKDALEAMLNFDMLAVGDTWPLVGSREIIDVATREAGSLGLTYSTAEALPENLGSDHANFIRAGIPSMLFNCFCDRNYHTAQDRFEFVEQERLSEAGALGLAIIRTLLHG